MARIRIGAQVRITGEQIVGIYNGIGRNGRALILYPGGRRRYPPADDVERMASPRVKRLPPPDVRLTTEQHRHRQNLGLSVDEYVSALDCC